MRSRNWVLVAALGLGGVALGAFGVLRYVTPDMADVGSEELRAELVKLGTTLQDASFPFDHLQSARQAAISAELARRFLNIEYPAMVARDQAEEELQSPHTVSADLNLLSR